MEIKNNHLLIYYNEKSDYRKSHPDPTFENEWSFCAGERLFKSGVGKYVFFHTTSKDPKTNKNKRYIKAYFLVKYICNGYRDPIVKELEGGAKHAFDIPNHCVIIGDKKKSKVLQKSIEFNKKLAKKLEFIPPKKIQFDIENKKGRTLSDLECISSATRNYRCLSESDVKWLLSKAK